MTNAKGYSKSSPSATTLVTSRGAPRPDIIDFDITLLSFLEIKVFSDHKVINAPYMIL